MFLVAVVKAGFLVGNTNSTACRGMMHKMLTAFRFYACWALLSLLLVPAASATPFTTVSPDGTALPSAYPEAGGVALILYGANGNIYYQFSDPAGAFVGFQNSGQPAAFRGNPFTINDPLTMDCGLQSCNEYFDNEIVKMEVRFTAQDGDTQQGGFDEDDISLLINGVNIGNWSDVPTQNTNTSGTTVISSQLGFGNRTYDTGWFSTTDATLLSGILNNLSITTQVLDDDPNDNYWNFRIGDSLANPGLARVAPAYTLEKRARSGSFAGPDITTFNAVGDTVYYTYDVRNVGSVRIDNLEVEDDRLGVVTCNPNTIAIGATATCQASHVVTQQEFDDQEITNIAIATGDPEFGQLGTLSDTVTLTGPGRNPSIEIVKTPKGGTYFADGETITYQFAVTNTGDVTLDNVAVTDPLIPALNCQQAELAPDGTLNCSFSYSVTQDDVDTGAINNRADVTSTDPAGTTTADFDTATNTAVQNPAFSVVKSTPSTPATVGQALTYNFAVRNDGNVSISAVTPVDAKCASAVTLASGDSDGDGDLDVGDTHTYTCTSEPLTQDEIDAGQVDNTVTVNGTPAGGTLAPATDDLSTPITRTSGFDIVKSTATTPAVDQPMVYSFVVTNTGNASISNVAIADNKCLAAPQLQSGDANTDNKLNATETWTYSCTSVDVTQDEVDAGTVNNTVAINGTGADGNPVPTGTDTLETPIPPAPAFSVLKTTTDTPTRAGERLTYNFAVTNDGNVTIFSPTLSDDKCASAISLVSGDTDGDGALDVGDTHNYSCQSVPVTQPEVDAGQVDNDVDVTGTPAGGILPPENGTNTVTIAPDPDLTLDKRLSDTSPTSFNNTTVVLTFDFVVTNSGNVTLTDPIVINDVSLDAPASCPPGDLAPDASITCTGSHTVTQQDIDDNQFVNTATASSGATTSDPDSVTVAAVQEPSLAIVKTATDPALFIPGALVEYDYVVTNDGNTTIPVTTPITIDDNRTTATCDPIPVGGLLPTQSLNCEASYFITSTDILLGTVTNTATATDGNVTSPTAVATIPSNLMPALGITKVVLPLSSDFDEAGDIITYEYTVQNTGGASFGGAVTVSDNKINGGTPFTCWAPNDASGNGAELDPDLTYPADPENNTNGETATCTADYAVTQDDIDAGFVDNEAVAETVFGPGAAQIPVASAPAVATATFTLPSSMTVAKAAAPSDLTTVAPGSVITYTFTLTNTGEVTLRDAAPVDSGPTFGGQAATNTLSTFTVTSGPDSNTDGRVDTIGPDDAPATVTATYVLTQEDIDNAAAAADPATSIANSATGTATPAVGTLDPVAPSTATTGFTPEPAFVATKSTTSVPEAAGDTLDYTFSVTNTGNVTINGLSLVDPKCDGGPNFLSGDLNTNSAFDVDEVWLYSCTSVAVTQDEVDAGEVVNTVTVSGTPTGGTLPDTTAENTTEIEPDGALSVAKSTASVVTEAGQTLEYSFVVTNVGNVSITPGVLADAKCAADPTLQSGDANSDTALNPTETWTYICTSIPVTQDEINAGLVVNTVTVPGTTPGGDPIDPPTDTVETPVTPAPDYSVTKATTSVPSVEGQELDYTFTVVNDGNVSIGNIILTDAKCQSAPELDSGDDNTNGTLEPIETFVYTCTSVGVTQAEIDAGEVVNTVGMTGNAPDGSALPPASDTLITEAVPLPSFVLAKSTTDVPTQAGDTLTYNFVLTNDGNATISTILIDDAKCAAAPVLDPASDAGGDDLLSPNEVWSLSCTSIAVTQAEVDAGQVDNTATATGTPTGGTLDPSEAGTSTDITGDPGVEIAKATTSTPTAAGDQLVYDFTVTNTGNTSLPVVTITDPKCSAAPELQSGDTNADDALNPTETWLYQCTSIPVTQVEVDAGEVINEATAEATDSLGNDAPPATAENTTDIPEAGAYSVVKGSVSQPTEANETLEYTFTVSNDGNVSISDIVVADDKCAATPALQSGDANSDGLLDPTETFVYICTSVAVTQEEIDAGVILNEVSVTGNVPEGTPLTPTTDTNTVPVTPMPGIEAIKTITSSGIELGDTVSFRIEVRNTGNVTLNSVGVDDTLTRTDGTGLVLDNPIGFFSSSLDSDAGTLLPDEVAVYTASYVLLQEDIDAGGLSNTATATGTPPVGSPVTDVSDDGVPGNGDDNPTPLVIPADPELGLVKSLVAVVKADGSTASSYDTIGDRLDYLFTVTNSGNVTITDAVTITDPLITDAGGTITCDPVPLAPLASLECRGSYVIDQDDLNTGTVNNTASATDGTTTSPDDVVLVEAIQDPAIETTKVARALPPAQFVTGATATYDYVTTNTGNVTLTTPIVIEDNLIDAANITCDPWPGSLLPGETYACVGNYTVTAADVDLGVVTNLARGTDGTITSPQVSESIPDNATPALGIVKTSPDLSAGFTTAGDLLTYNFEITNTGERAFARAVTVTDNRIGTIDCFVPSASNPDFTAGEVATCSAQYEVTQDDLDAGFVTNEAFAQTIFGNDTTVVSAPDTVTIDAVRDPALVTTKTATLPAGRTNETLIAGDVLRYIIEVSNTGNLTLRNITISDPRLSLTCDLAVLAPQGSDDSCQADYIVTQDDIDAGQITNAAFATGSDPQGETVSDGTTVVTPMPTPNTELVVRKTANVSPFGPVGSTIAYSFEVENAGNVTLRDVSLTDPRVPGYSCSIARLLPQEIDTSCATPYIVTQADVDAGSIVNTATATSTDPDGNTVTGSGTVATPGPNPAGALEATKTFDFDGSVAGSNVTFSVTIANTGNVTLTDVVPVDTLTRSNGDPLALAAPGLSYLSGDLDNDDALDVGELWQYTGSYVLTQDDINAGGIENVVDVTARDPNDDPVTDRADDGDDGDGNTADDPTVFVIPVGPSIEATKVISTTGAIAGDTIVFNINLRNLGNVDLENVTIADDLSREDGTPIVQTNTPQLISGDANNNGILNLTETWVYQLPYVLTQGDIDAGGITNVATATAQDESGGSVSDVADNGTDSDGNSVDDPTVLTIPPMPELTLRKSVVTAATEVDEVATFLIEVENTGNVTLRGLTLEDTLTRLDGTPLTLTSGPTEGTATAGSTAAAIIPDGIVQFTATYQLVQEDIDAGGVANTALGTASTPDGGVVTDVSDDPDNPSTGPSDPTVMPIERLPSLVVEKSAISGRLLFPTVFEIGFQITVENDGNTILTDLQVQDDLAAFAAPATILTTEFPTTVSVSGLTSGTANPAFDGVSDTGLLAPGATLARGETATFTIVTTYEATAGFPAPGENTASATSTELLTPSEGTTIATNVDSDGDGVPDGIESDDTDRDGDGIPDAQDYDPTGYFYCEDSGRILTGGLITITGNGFSQTGVGTSGPIRVIRDGASGEYQFYVTRPGNYQLSYTPPANDPSETLLATTTPADVTNLVDVLTGTATTNPRILGSSEFGSRGTLTDFSPAANPAFYTNFVFEAGDPVVFSNNIPFQCTSIGDLTASKAVLGTSDVRLGDTVTYQLTYELADTAADLRNLTFTDLLPVGISYVPDSAQISRAGADPIPLEPTSAGRSLTWSGEMMTAGTTTVITFNGRVGPNAPTGNLVNQTFVRGPTGEILSNFAEAVVRRIPEHVFDCSDVIGTVFDDVNRNGYQDGPAGQSAVTDQDYLGGKGKVARPAPLHEGEPGLPGVRIATVNGTLITTDEHGRFHVPCAELPSSIGTNFLLKVDERSLPSGYRITTENPRVVRLTAGKFAKMNFGATISRVIDINLSGAAFAQGTAPTAKLQQAVRNLAKTLQSEPSVVRLAYVAGDEAEVKLGRARMRVVEKLLKREWRRSGTYKLTIEKTIKRRR